MYDALLALRLTHYYTTNLPETVDLLWHIRNNRALMLNRVHDREIKRLGEKFNVSTSLQPAGKIELTDLGN
jgi:hypothetical protein